MIGTSTSAGRLRRARTKLAPSMSGMLKSVMIRSGAGPASNAASASTGPAKALTDQTFLDRRGEACQDVAVGDAIVDDGDSRHPASRSMAPSRRVRNRQPLMHGA